MGTPQRSDSDPRADSLLRGLFGSCRAAHWGPFPFVISWLRSARSHLPRPKRGESTAETPSLDVRWRFSHGSCDFAGRWDWRDSTMPECVYFCSCSCVGSLGQSPWSEWFKRKVYLLGSRSQKVQPAVLRSYCSGPVARPFVTVGETEETARFMTSGKDQDLKIPFRGRHTTQQWSKCPWLCTPA